ncbi:MAG: DNA cytosine methyltransferase, partial [Fibrobacter sp.]|nr:DNA cytosine methyltransferase [Fibrobacter sp.]
MKVLSLFDGMSCGQIALRELGIIPEKYYASEIDKHAIAQTQYNFPDTIQLGSVTDVDARKLGHIDLLIGGSPCTNFSFAG